MLLLDLDCNANGKTRNQPAAISRRVAHGVAVRCAQGGPLGDMYGERYRSARGHLHAKMVLAARTMVVGSFNWTNSSTNNLEMGSVVELSEAQSRWALHVFYRWWDGAAGAVSPSRSGSVDADRRLQELPGHYGPLLWSDSALPTPYRHDSHVDPHVGSSLFN